MMNYHRLLRRQLKKAALDQKIMTAISPLLEQINQAYLEADNDLSHIENILEKSSQELFSVNQQLKQNVEVISSQLERVVNNIHEVIFETDLQGKWTYLNPAWEKLTGYYVEDCIGLSMKDYLNSISTDIHKNNIDIAKLNFERQHHIIQIKTLDNEQKWLDVSIQLSKDKDYVVQGCIGTIIDISYLKKTELALIEAKDKETQASRAKDEFLSTMSHEIRTPLNAVIGISHLLLMEDPKASQIENLNALKYSSEHLLGLVNDILDFNKIESGSLDLESVDFSLSHILNGLQSSFQLKAEDKGIKFIIKKDDLLPNVLVGDSMRLSQVLTNLVNNAIKFTNKGKVILDIEVIKKQNKTISLLFSIQDTGIGIPADKLEKIFDSFAQANSNTTRKYGGTGLGLAISRKLLDLMGSDLKVDSIEHKGSNFYFQIDFIISEKFDQVKPKHATTPPSYGSLKGLKVLVVEDHKINIMVIERFLKKWEVDYEIALNGLIATQKAQNIDYHLILMDLQMPVMNGYDASTEIRKSGTSQNQNIPIYALSASAALDVKENVIKYGMDGHISKPFNPSDLYQILKNVKNNL